MTSLPDRLPLLAALTLLSACGAGMDPPVLCLPERDANSPTGSAIVGELVGLTLEAREDRLAGEILAGNIPPSLRDLRPVDIERREGERVHHLRFWVQPDYLAVGSADDEVRVPLSYRTANLIADRTNAMLPTPALVDEIWRASDVKLAPIRLPPGEEMATVDYFDRHDRLIKAQRFLFGVDPEAFVAGIKVDLVRLADGEVPDEGMAIYGWHQENGRPIQPVFRRASDRFVSFNQGVRLVSRVVEVDGVGRTVAEALSDPAIAPLLRPLTADPGATGLTGSGCGPVTGFRS